MCDGLREVGSGRRNSHRPRATGGGYSSRVSGSPELQRVHAIDAARGVAIALMVLSHTVKGLMSFEMMPDLGIVPVHLLTKFSSSLFFLTFGASVAVVHFPRVDDAERWARARWKLLWRGLVIMVSYKVLTVVQMFERNSWESILDALLWKRFPDFVEVLQFYAFFMLLLPFVLRPLSRLSVVGLLFFAWMLGLASDTVREAYDFGGVWQLQAVLVEHPKAFCFGLFTRGAFVLVGMALGKALGRGPSAAPARELATGWNRVDPWGQRSQVGGALLAVGVAALATFFAMHWEELGKVTLALAKNWGKHPPNLPFLLWSVGGAALVLGLLLRLEAAGRRPLAWLEHLGRESLLCFNLHILVIFLLFRGAFGLRHEVSYGEALGLTLVNLGLCGLAIYGAGRLSTLWRDWRDHDDVEPSHARPEPPQLVDPEETLVMVADQLVLEQETSHASSSSRGRRRVRDGGSSRH